MDIVKAIYRKFLFGLKKIRLAEKHIMFDTRAYIDRRTETVGYNYFGYNSFLSSCKVDFGTYIADFTILYHTSIGKYCSIGSGVVTAVGHHPINECISTSPSFFSETPPNGISYCINGYQERKIVRDSGYSIQIGNDVWIGSHVTLLEGITIGDGAIIGAGSVVTNSVEPYGVYCGNPARFVRWRFDENKRNELEQMRWWDREPSWIKENLHLFQFN